MWKAALDSQKGSYSVYMKIQDGEDIVELLGEYEYENRSDGFYYKKTDYNIEPDGTRKQSRMIESFESGRKLAFDGGAPMEASPGVVVDPITLENLIGGVWKEMTLDNVKNISIDKDGKETSYCVEYIVEDKAHKFGSPDSNKWVTLTERTMTVTYDEQEKRIKKIEDMASGIENSTEDVIISTYVLTFD